MKVLRAIVLMLSLSLVGCADNPMYDAGLDLSMAATSAASLDPVGTVLYGVSGLTKATLIAAGYIMHDDCLSKDNTDFESRGEKVDCENTVSPDSSVPVIFSDPYHGRKIQKTDAHQTAISE